MKNVLPLCFFIALCSCNSSDAIFREINVNSEYGEVALGDYIQDLEDIIEIKEGTILLRKTTFGGAKSIELVASKTGHVEAMIFKYKNKAHFDDAIKSYTKRLGEPQFVNDKYVWKDKRTHFEIGFTKDGECFYSKLSDLKK